MLHQGAYYCLQTLHLPTCFFYFPLSHPTFVSFYTLVCPFTIVLIANSTLSLKSSSQHPRTTHPSWSPPRQKTPFQTYSPITRRHGLPKTSYTASPHVLAARFYRTAHSRRRGSAASSRRNSMTSSHSKHSSRSHRSHRPHENSCIAQQLRRQSIIESRRARLASRSAHVEEVRLRAALAKAAPRTSNSEEKAQAAQLAREKILAKVAASCAEEVNRAKRVAEEKQGEEGG